MVIVAVDAAVVVTDGVPPPVAAAPPACTWELRCAHALLVGALASCDAADCCGGWDLGGWVGCWDWLGEAVEERFCGVREVGVEAADWLCWR